MENYSNPVQNQSGIPPKTWLVESILVTIFCCQILGIISIIYSAGVESKFYRGDVAGAESASRTAKTLVMVSVGIGLVSIVIFVALGGMAILSGMMNR
ncbi:CD225/dispanin family protein [Halpernia frigidisoli]|uniref:Interferon-induced transmembrane protein n=1 Tax=Halpernia frigidisoli TaxID=1125876 RepID=A0A1I3I4C3_9FLAO|nr:CD225/dispanin family protein [Halpernia frigidisoli]SFI42834.1 Interferon-induced transmembrane protein [Halpernia frigidisoli]